jgi:hypothetical protein
MFPYARGSQEMISLATSVGDRLAARRILKGLAKQDMAATTELLLKDPNCHIDEILDVSPPEPIMTAADVLGIQAVKDRNNSKTMRYLGLCFPRFAKVAYITAAADEQQL